MAKRKKKKESGMTALARHEGAKAENKAAKAAVADAERAAAIAHEALQPKTLDALDKCRAAFERDKRPKDAKALEELVEILRCHAERKAEGAIIAPLTVLLDGQALRGLTYVGPISLPEGTWRAFLLPDGICGLLAMVAVDEHRLSALAFVAERLPRTVKPFWPRQRASLPRLHCVSAEEVQRLPLFTTERAQDAQPVLATLDGSPPVFAAPGLPINSSWLLALFDQTGGQSMKPGRGAPWDLQIFIGALIHTPVRARTGHVVTLSFSTDKIVEWIHPEGWTNRARDWGKFTAALESVGSHCIPTSAGMVGLVYARVIPHSWADGRGVVLETRIPRSAAAGARIDWPMLCRYRTESAPLYRAYLSVCAFMDRSAHNGQPLSRQIHPPLFHPDGRKKRRKGGWILRDEASLVVNPMANRVPTLTIEQARIMFGLRDSRTSRMRARRLLEQLEADGIVEVEDLGHGSLRLFAQRCKSKKTFPLGASSGRFKRPRDETPSPSPDLSSGEIRGDQGQK